MFRHCSQAANEIVKGCIAEFKYADMKRQTMKICEEEEVSSSTTELVTEREPVFAVSNGKLTNQSEAFVSEACY